jgi:hypothetical protein
LTWLVLSRCAFDADAVLVSLTMAQKLLATAGLSLGPSGYILFFPWRSRLARSVERRVRSLPLGAQYFVTGPVR